MFPKLITHPIIIRSMRKFVNDLSSYKFGCKNIIFRRKKPKSKNFRSKLNHIKLFGKSFSFQNNIWRRHHIFCFKKNEIAFLAYFVAGTKTELGVHKTSKQIFLPTFAPVLSCVWKWFFSMIQAHSAENDKKISLPIIDHFQITFGSKGNFLLCYLNASTVLKFASAHLSWDSTQAITEMNHIVCFKHSKIKNSSFKFVFFCDEWWDEVRRTRTNEITSNGLDNAIYSYNMSTTASILWHWVIFSAKIVTR